MRFVSLFRTPTVGLDIGSSGVRAVALQGARQEWSLLAVGHRELGFDHSAGDRSPLPADVSGAVKQLFGGMKLRRARVAAALSGRDAVVKRLSLPVMAPAELAEAISWEAEQHFPVGLAEVALDYQLMGASEDASPTLDVLLVAARKDRIQGRTAVIAAARRATTVLDVEAFALANAYEINYPGRIDPLAALVHIGRSATIVSILERGELVFTRDILVAGHLCSLALQRELGLNVERAEQSLRGQIPPDVSRDQVRGVLRATTGQIVHEIGKTIDSYRASAPIERLSRVVVSGGGCGAEGLVDLLRATLDAPVEVLDPFRNLARLRRTDGAVPGGAAYAIAVGLAMRRAADR